MLSAGVFTGLSKPIGAVADSAGNKWTKAGAYAVSGQNSDGELWYSVDAAPTSTVTVTTGASTVALRVQEFSGVATSSPLDGSTGIAATSTAANSGQVTPTGANDLAVGFIAGHSNVEVPSNTSPGYTLQPQVITTSPSATTVTSGYQDLSASGPQSFSGTISSAMYWSAGIALFKASSPPPPSDFSIAAAPNSVTVAAGSSTTTTVNTTIASGAAQSVALTASGVPAGTAVSFNPATISSGQSSVATLVTSPTTPVGSSLISVTGTGTAAMHSTSVSLTVSPATQAPSITSAAAAAFSVSTPGTFTVTSSGTPTAALSESGTLPAGVGFVDNGDGTGTLSGTPASGSTGTYSLSLSATNGVGTPASQTFTLIVSPATQAPSITSAAAAAFSVSTPGTFTVTSSGTPTAALSESGTLPAGVGFVDNGDGTGTLSGTPASGSTGTYSLSLSATNGVGTPASQTFTLIVSPATQAPSITSAAAAAFSVSTPGTFTVTSSGTPTAALSESGTLPAGVGFVDNGDGTGTLSGTPASGSTGTYSLSLSATNGVGTPASQTFTLIVSPAIRFVQSASGTETTTATSLTAGFPSATTTGDLLVLSASVYTGTTNHITSVTDSAGNSWTRIGAFSISSHNSDGEMWYSSNATSASTVTVHTASAASVSFEVQEFAGVAASSPLDASIGSSNTGTTANSGTVTPTLANELVVGFIAGHATAQSITVTAPGYTLQPQQTSTGPVASLISGYRVLGLPVAQSIAGSFNSAMYWAAGVALFKPTG